jgi:hypothetical protein
MHWRMRQALRPHPVLERHSCLRFRFALKGVLCGLPAKIAIAVREATKKEARH